MFEKINTSLRQFLNHHPRLKIFCRKTLNICWWIITLQLYKKLNERLLFKPPKWYFNKQKNKKSNYTHPIRIVYISGEAHTPGHLYRVVRYAEAATSAGFEVHIVPIEEVMQKIKIIPMAHIVIIWRTPWSQTLERVITLARIWNIKIIFDIDDLMTEPNLAKTKYIDGIRTNGMEEKHVREFYERMYETLTKANICTAPTHFLAKRMQDMGRKPALVLPNGFDSNVLMRSRLATRMRRQSIQDNLIRIGYAAGTLTHQKDFAQITEVICQILNEYPHCRLVLFYKGDIELLKVSEFPTLQNMSAQIEWRPMVTLNKLPDEIARFDINIAPLESDNIFCNAKSELKYFEAALVEVPTVASPTDPFRRAIQEGITGFLANTSAEWYEKLKHLIENKELRQRIGHNAYYDVLWKYGPERRIELMKLLVEQEYPGGQPAAHALFELSIAKNAQNHSRPPVIPPHEILIEFDTLKISQVTIIIPLYNCAHYLEHALETVKAQTFTDIDLVIVDDDSSDNSLEIAKKWIEINRTRFNRVILAKNQENAGLGLTRNVAFSLAETPFVLPLNADNELVPHCVQQCLQAIISSNAAFAYPIIERFSDSHVLIGTQYYNSSDFINGNHIDALVLIRKASWAALSVYHEMRLGFEVYDLGCKFVEVGFFGVPVPQN